VPRLKVGVIGLGVGEKHVEAYESRSDCEVAVICDIAAEKLREVSSRHPGIPTTAIADEVLADPSIDVVSIATFDDCHHRQVVTALDAGKHVFVEKPLCLNAIELADIGQHLSRRPQLKISSNLILRRSPRFAELRQFMAAGELGEIFSIEGDYLYGRLSKITEGWRSQVEGYSVVHGGGIHLLDLMAWLIDDRIVEVSAFGNAIASRGSAFRYNDNVVAILKFSRGAVGRLSANFGCIHPHYHALNVFGTRATFMNGIDHARLYTSRDPAVEPEAIRTPYPGVHKGELIHSFLESIVSGAAEEISAEDVLRTMAVSIAVDEAVRRGSVVRVQEFEASR
jgi:predicted dehydrogenase